MSKIPCIKGCIYYRGMDARHKAICDSPHVPKPRNVDPDVGCDVGCYWGERAPTERRTNDDDKSQSTLF